MVLPKFGFTVYGRDLAEIQAKADAVVLALAGEVVAFHYETIELEPFTLKDKLTLDESPEQWAAHVTGGFGPAGID